MSHLPRRGPGLSLSTQGTSRQACDMPPITLPGRRKGPTRRKGPVRPEPAKWGSHFSRCCHVSPTAPSPSSSRFSPSRSVSSAVDSGIAASSRSDGSGITSPGCSHESSWAASVAASAAQPRPACCDPPAEETLSADRAGWSAGAPAANTHHCWVGVLLFLGQNIYTLLPGNLNCSARSSPTAQHAGCQLSLMSKHIMFQQDAHSIAPAHGVPVPA